MKRLIYMLVVLLGFASCQKETPQPTPQPIPTSTNSFDLVSMVGDAVSVDSIRYRNIETGFIQVDSPPPLNVYCTGTDHNTVTSTLGEPMLMTENCEITVYFTPNQGLKIFHVLLFKSSDGLCDSYGGQGWPIQFSGDVYVTYR